MSKKIFLSALLLLLVGCSQNRPNAANNTRIARVGSHYLTLDKARKAIPNFVWQQDSLKALKKFRREWIHKQLLLQKAADMQLAGKAEVQQRLQEARKKVLANAVRELTIAEYASKNEISDQEALQFYNDHQKQFVLNERFVQFRHVSNTKVEFVRKARQELLSGTPWPKVARMYSNHSKKRVQQSQKFWPESAVLNDFPTLERYVASLDSGQISPVRQIDGAYHFIQLTGARDKGEHAKYKWVLNELKNWLMLEKKRQFFKSYVKNLYLKAEENNEIELYNVLNNSK